MIDADDVKTSSTAPADSRGSRSVHLVEDSERARTKAIPAYPYLFAMPLARSRVHAVC